MTLTKEDVASAIMAAGNDLEALTDGLVALVAEEVMDAGGVVAMDESNPAPSILRLSVDEIEVVVEALDNLGGGLDPETAANNPVYSDLLEKLGFGVEAGVRAISEIIVVFDDGEVAEAYDLPSEGKEDDPE
jgi:hypothetical protein